MKSSIQLFKITLSKKYQTEFYISQKNDTRQNLRKRRSSLWHLDYVIRFALSVARYNVRKTHKYM